VIKHRWLSQALTKVSSAAYLTHVILTIANQIVIIIVIISPWTGDEIQFVTKDIRGNERLTEERTTLMKLFCAAERASGAGFSSTLTLSNWVGIIFSLIVGRVGDIGLLLVAML